MAKKLLTSYTFTTGAENVGTVAVLGTYTLEQFLLITNVTNGTILYQFDVPQRGATLVSAGGYTTLTLEIDTRSMSASDRLQVFVDDGQNAQVTLTNASVEISNDVGNPVPVSGTVTATGPLTDTQLRASAVPVSATALPLPSGAATSSNQSTANASLASLDSKAPMLVTGRVPVDGSGVTQPVSAASLPLPTGAATAANQSTANSSLASLDGKAPALVAGRVPVDGSGVTQPVSGPLTDTQLRATAVSVAPNITRGSGVADANTQRVTLASDGPAVTALSNIDSKTPALVSGRQPVDGSGVTQPISAASLPLPTGAATETTLSSVNTKLPSLVSGSLPVLVQNGQLEIQNDTGNPIPMGPAATQALSGSASANNTDLFSVDCSAFRSINFQITGTWVGTITFQASNDNTNWNSYVLFQGGGGNATIASITANNFLYGSTSGCNFFRIRFTAYSSGTATVTGFLLKEPVSGAISSGSAQISIGTTTTGSSSTLPYAVNSAASTNGASIKASGANLYGMSVMNASASTKYVRFFNKASAPTMGTDVPIMVVAVPATSSKEIEYVPAMRFGTGLAVAITGGAAATDSTAVAAGDVQLMVSYA